MSLPASIQGSVPDCAQSCLSTYVSQTFTNCSPTDLTCMCTEYSSQGYTLGELAYLCVKVDCTANISAQASAYSICSAQSGNVPALHSSVLTQPPTSTLQPASTTTTTVVGTGATTSSKATVTPAVTSGLVFTATTTVTTSVGSQATATNDTGRLGSALTNEQAIGIIVGALGGLLLLLLLIFCCFCCRRRKGKKDKNNKKNHNSYDFVDKEPRRAWRMKYASFGDRPAENQQQSVAQQPVAEKEGSRPTAYMQDGDVERNQHPPASRGTQATHESTRPASRDSRVSITSARTVSQLLPDKPTIVHIQPPSRSHTVRRKDARPDVPQKSPKQSDLYTPATVFEEDRPAFVPGLPANPGVYRAYKAPGQQPAELSATKPTERSHQPSLSLEIPRTASKPIAKAATAWPLPVNVAPGESTSTVTKPVDERNAVIKPKPSPSNVSLLDYYAQSHGSGGSTAAHSTSSDEAEQRRRAVPQALVIKKAEPRPQASRQSSASDTSFESIGDDDPTPPAEAEKQLTPVAETSPISDIRYPKVPRSSNQAVSRSPKLMVPTKRSDSSIGAMCRSPETADSRRRAHQPLTPERQNFRNSPSLSGTTITHHQSKATQTCDPDNGLRILNSYDPSYQSKALQQKASGTLRTPPASPLNGYEKDHSATTTSGMTNHTRRGPNGRLVLQMDKTKTSAAAAAPESPRWAPKLTPQRQGDDLYLSVSVGSPLHQSQFPPSAYAAPAAPHAR